MTNYDQPCVHEPEPRTCARCDHLEQKNERLDTQFVEIQEERDTYKDALEAIIKLARESLGDEKIGSWTK